VGGWLSLKFGPKIVLGITILIASILTVLTPVAAQLSFVLLIFLRFVIGLAQVEH
jgi:MFS family permease